MKVDDGILRIGFAGTLSHYDDLELVRRALEWASAQEGVQVHCFGLNPKKWRFPFTVWDWTEDLAYYRTTLSLLDVGLCPLLQTKFNESKSDIKAMEYAMAGALPIVSAVEAYRVGWQNRPCLTARNSKEFLQAVRFCVRNRDEVKRLAAEAREYVLRERTIDKHIWRSQEALELVTEGR